MDKFEEKYGIEETEKVKTFHRSRRMFCIHQNRLYVAKPNLSYSHAVWFEKEGWISRQKDKLIDKITRGFVDNSGDIYFYTEYDFRINPDIELVFFSHLGGLVGKLNLKLNSKIFGGLIKPQTSGEKWKPRKDYGTIKSQLSNLKK